MCKECFSNCKECNHLLRMCVLHLHHLWPMQHDVENTRWHLNCTAYQTHRLLTHAALQERFDCRCSLSN